ncbi:MAG: acyl-CoA dehydrogenase family protein, partial [Pseudomonadota bacterium]
MPSESSQVFADSAADYLGANDQRQRVRQLEDSDGGFERATWQQIAELGWLSIMVPENDGGLGLGLEEVAAIAQEAGRHLLPEPFVDAGVHPVALLYKASASELRNELLAELQTGDLVVGVAWQEHAGEMEPSPATVTAFDADTQQLTGRKRFVRPGPGADGWLVLAGVNGEAVIVWVNANAEGVTLAQERGVDGSVTGTLSFEASPARLLARGDAAMAALCFANEAARMAQAAELAGIARRALELTREYMTTREQFGKPIGSFQALQHRMVDGLIQVELAEACLREGLKLAGQATSADSLAAITSRVKARCAWAATEVTRMAIQLHGAIGTTNEYDVGLYFKRAMLLASRWGNATAHRRRYARLTSVHTQKPVPSSTGTAAYFSANADWDNMPEPDFRQRVRALFAQHYPEHRRYMPYRQSWAESRDWYLTLSRLGWLAPAWPKQYGGMGLPADKLIAWIEETEAWGVARCPDQGLVMVGPILMRFGNDEQRARFLPPILAGEHVWTQGYSEPNAGSDLAAVRTEAVIDGNDFIVNGQKTWTTWGSDGTHMFMLVRTDKTVKKQA